VGIVLMKAAQVPPAPRRGADLSEQIGGAVLTAVLDDDDLDGIAAEAWPAVEALPRKLLVVEGRDHHGEAGHRVITSVQPSVCLKVECQRRAAAAGQRTRESKRRETRPAAAGSLGQFWRGRGDPDVVKAGTLERAGKRRRGKMIHVNQIVGDRRAIAGPQPRSKILFQAL